MSADSNSTTKIVTRAFNFIIVNRILFCTGCSWKKDNMPRSVVSIQKLLWKSIMLGWDYIRSFLGPQDLSANVVVREHVSGYYSLCKELSPVYYCYTERKEKVTTNALYPILRMGNSKRSDGYLISAYSKHIHQHKRLNIFGG